MKILMLNPPFFSRFSRAQRSPAVTKSGTLYYPIWLAYATGVLEKEGFDVFLIDAVAQGLTRNSLAKRVQELRPELIVMDTSTPSIYNDLEVGEALKNILPDSFITLVGTHVSALPEETLRLNSSIDAVARKEYDYTLCALARALDKKAKIESVLGLSFRRGDEIVHNADRKKIKDLNELPFVSQVYAKHLNVQDYFFAAADHPMVQIFTARGCPFRCAFCVYPQTLHGNEYRTRSPENIVSEFIFIKNNLPEIKEVVIEDDTFSVDKLRVKKICQLLIQNKIGLKWNANVRADLDLETMKLMKQAGCRLIITGFESADQTILNNIEKDSQAHEIDAFFNDTRKAGLLVHAAFMAGNPGETEETLEKTFNFAKRHMPDTVQFFPLMVYPGTKAYEWAKTNNYLSSQLYSDWLTKDGLHNCVVNLPNMSALTLVEWCNKSRKRYYLSIRYITYKLKQIMFHPSEAKRTVIAFARFWKYLTGKVT